MSTCRQGSPLLRRLSLGAPDFVIEYCKNGELLSWIKKLGSFDEECARFYIAEIILALEHMHERGIIHRDLKPENILLSETMHVKITDFGTSKILDEESDGTRWSGAGPAPHLREPLSSSRLLPPPAFCRRWLTCCAAALCLGTCAGRANSFVGTAQYVSPELLTDKVAFKSSDLWAVGVILYQLLSGKPPFRGGNAHLTFQKVKSGEYEVPNMFPPKGLVSRRLLLRLSLPPRHASGLARVMCCGAPSAPVMLTARAETSQDLVQKLLVLDPTKRLGSPEMGGFGPLKAHPFFDGRPRWHTRRVVCCPGVAAELPSRRAVASHPSAPCFAPLLHAPHSLGMDWDTLPDQKPPRLEAYLPAMSADDVNLHETDTADDVLADMTALAIKGAVRMLRRRFLAHM